MPWAYSGKRQEVTTNLTKKARNDGRGKIEAPIFIFDLPLLPVVDKLRRLLLRLYWSMIGMLCTYREWRMDLVDEFAKMV